MMNRLSDKWLGGVFCGWLGLFWLSYWVGAPVPAVVGNRALASFPDKSVDPFSSAWLQKVSAWGIDHSPFRFRTLVERNQVLLKAAKALQPIPVCPGNSEVAMGRDGWLFLMDEIPDNRTRREIEKMTANAVKIARDVTASGRRFFLMPVPDKSSVYPDYKGTLMRWADNQPLREQSWAMMDHGFINAPDVHDSYQPLWEVYARARQKTPDLLYWEQDTHWNANGMLVALPQLLERLQPGVWDAQAVHPDGMDDHYCDLSLSFLLQSGTSSRPKYRLARAIPEKVESFTLPAFGYAAINRYRSTEPRSVKGRTLIITDSFLDGATPLFAPWFEDVTFAHFSCTGSPELAERISQCDTLVFTSVERYLRWRLSVWGTHRRDYLLKALSVHPTTPAKP